MSVWEGNKSQAGSLESITGPALGAAGPNWKHFCRAPGSQRRSVES